MVYFYGFTIAGSPQVLTLPESYPFGIESLELGDRAWYAVALWDTHQG